MTDDEAREYFKDLAEFLDKKAKTVMSLKPNERRPWAIDVRDKMVLQITRPTGIQLFSSTTALEKEFVSFLRAWRKDKPASGSAIDVNYHAQSVMAAGVYLRHLSRLYKEIHK